MSLLLSEGGLVWWASALLREACMLFLIIISHCEPYIGARGQREWREELKYYAEESCLVTGSFLWRGFNFLITALHL